MIRREEKRDKSVETGRQKDLWRPGVLEPPRVDRLPAQNPGPARGQVPQGASKLPEGTEDREDVYWRWSEQQTLPRPYMLPAREAGYCLSPGPARDRRLSPWRSWL